MTGDLHDNAEKQTLAPVGVQGDAASLSQNTQTMFTPMAGFRAASEPASLDFGNPTDIYGKESVVAQNYEDVRQAGLRTDIVRVASPPDVANPYRGFELHTLDKAIPAEQWQTAVSGFPEIQANLSQQDAIRLSKAIVANELEHYGPEDRMQDTWAKLSGGIGENKMTLGFSQITPAGVKDMAQELEKDVQAGRREQNPLNKYLDMTDKQIVSALEDPKQAPLLVAANIAHNIRMYERHGIPITSETLGYGFNPDILFAQNDKKHEHPLTQNEARQLEAQGIKTDKALIPTPTVLQRSEHAANITRWLTRLGSE